MDLSAFDNSHFDRGASRAREYLWLLVRRGWFLNSISPSYRRRRSLLRAFGAIIGEHVVIKPGVKITFPWRLTVGSHSWIGEDVTLHNLAPIHIGHNVCLSQRAFLCTGSHDWSHPHFELITKPISVEDSAWVCANVFVGPGLTVETGAVATAGSVVTHSLPANMICTGNPCVPVRPRVAGRPAGG